MTPEGWETVKLKQITQPSSEKVEPSEMPSAAYLSLEHLEGGTNKIIGMGQSSDVKSTKAVFRPGDVLYGKLRPYLNKVTVPDFHGICSTDILVFPKSENLSSRFLMWFLSQPSVVAYANHNSSGVQLPRVSFKALGEFEVPIPPLAEQRRIVAKVEELLAEVNAARDRLAKVPAILKRFRQSVLAAACSGRLTEDWRARKPNFDAQGLIEKIHASRVKSEPKWHPEKALDGGKLWPEIPDSWRWLSVSELLRTSKGLSYGILKPGKPDPKGVQMLRVMDIADGCLADTEIVRVSKKLSDEYARTRLERGDVLLAVMATIGRSMVVPPELEGSNVNRALAVLKVNRLFDSNFLCAVIRSPYFQEVFSSEKKGSAQARINLGDLRKFPVPVPPVEEQKEILARMENLFCIAANIEASFWRSHHMTELLPQAILSRAFRGELVPTEAELAQAEGRDYEPASVLLERIQASRQAQKPKKMAARNRAKKK